MSVQVLVPFWLTFTAAFETAASAARPAVTSAAVWAAASASAEAAVVVPAVPAATTVRLPVIQEWMRQWKTYVPGAAVTVTKNGAKGGAESGAPMLTIEVPSNTHGWSAVPHPWAGTCKTAGICSTVFSWPPGLRAVSSMSAAAMPLTSWSAAAVHDDGSRVAVWKPPPFANWKVPPWAIVGAPREEVVERPVVPGRDGRNCQPRS